MKIRSDFVSNSSSSSFFIVGHAFDIDEIKKAYLVLHPECEPKLDEDSDEYDEDLYDDLPWALAQDLELKCENGIQDYYDMYAIGLYFSDMKDDETKSQFIGRIKECFKKIDVTEVEPMKDGGYEG